MTDKASITDNLPKSLISGGLPKYWVWGDDERPAKFENDIFYIIERDDPEWSPRNDLAVRIVRDGRYLQSKTSIKDWEEVVKNHVDAAMAKRSEQS